MQSFTFQNDGMVILFFFLFSGWDGVRHAQILPPQNDRHVGQEVLLRTRHNRSVHHHLSNTDSQIHCNEMRVVGGWCEIFSRAFSIAAQRLSTGMFHINSLQILAPHWLRFSLFLYVFWIAEGRAAGFVLEGCPHTLSWEDLSHPAVPSRNRYLILSHNLTLPCPFSVVLIEEQYPRFSYLVIRVHTSILIGTSNLISIWPHVIVGLIHQLGRLTGLIFVGYCKSKVQVHVAEDVFFSSSSQEFLSTFDVLYWFRCCLTAL